MPYSQIAGQPSNLFFQQSPFDRRQQLGMMQEGEMSPEELTLMRLLGNRPDARRPMSPSAQPAAIQNGNPGFLEMLFSFLGAEPASQAMQQSVQSHQRQR